MKYSIFILILFTSFFSKAQTKKNITYDFSCLYDNPFDQLAGIGNGIENIGISMFGEKVPVSEETKAGEGVITELKKKWRFISGGVKVERITKLMNRLVSVIQNPRGFNYDIYLVDTSMVNAFTIGGKIVITTAIYDFCKSDDELACVIGHEISHNELGHLNSRMSKIKSAEKWGFPGVFAVSLSNFLTVSFNQENEAHSDLLGIDLVQSIGLNGCGAESLWRRMNEKEGKYSPITTFFRSHPYSAKRAVCAKNHIKTNYSITCND